MNEKRDAPEIKTMAFLVGKSLFLIALSRRNDLKPARDPGGGGWGGGGQLSGGQLIRVVPMHYSILLNFCILTVFVTFSVIFSFNSY